MPRRELVKSIEDDYGNKHTYTLHQHPADEGFELVTTILKIVGSVGGVFIDGISSEEGEEDPDVNGEKIGLAFTRLAEEIVTAGGTSFCKKLLRYTTRTNDNGGEDKVHEHFSMIYQGNYGELIMAVWFAVDSNFGPSLRARLGSVDNISNKIASLSVLNA